MGDLVTDVKTADPQIATRWQTRVARKMDKPVLTVADIDFIVADLVKQARRSDITNKQGEALMLVTNASIVADSTKSVPGIKRLIYYVNMWEKAHRLNITPVVEQEELLNIANFLRDAAVNHVIFTSPGTNIIYAPYDYIAVGQLVLNKEVLVAFSKTSGLSEYAGDLGVYSSEHNVMRINVATPLNVKLTIVHEATHVIQDWKDISSQSKFNEADAHIAEAIARIHLTNDPPEGPVAKAAAAAADMVVKKTAIADSQPWKTAYDNVVSEVARTYKNRGVHNNTRGETRSEKTTFQRILKEITVINEVINGLNKEITQLLLRVLP